jgi:hypothetical protein
MNELKPGQVIAGTVVVHRWQVGGKLVATVLAGLALAGTLTVYHNTAVQPATQTIRNGGKPGPGGTIHVGG